MVEESPEQHAHNERKRENEREHKLNIWKKHLAYAFIVSIIFDFVIMPMIYEYRKEIYLEAIEGFADLEVAVQVSIIESSSWTPLTLQGAGMYYLAMGAILTGTAIAGNKGLQSKGS